jgi:hypothetical protein
MNISAIILLAGFKPCQIGSVPMEKEGAMMAKLPDGWVFITKAERMAIGLEEHELIMCKNCKHNDEFGCHKLGMIVSESWFCADGERRETE